MEQNSIKIHIIGTCTKPSRCGSYISPLVSNDCIIPYDQLQKDNILFLWLFVTLCIKDVSKTKKPTSDLTI